MTIHIPLQTEEEYDSRLARGEPYPGESTRNSGSRRYSRYLQNIKNDIAQAESLSREVNKLATATKGELDRCRWQFQVVQRALYLRARPPPERRHPPRPA